MRLMSSLLLKNSTKEDSEAPDGGWYALRLRMSIGKTVAALPEYLYTVEKRLQEEWREAA